MSNTKNSRKAETTRNNGFEGYAIEYITNLLTIVDGDVQNNCPVFEDDYMTVALDTCINFN